ncbi:hypothetical protein [Croceicoccus sp. YJ47]|uniref:hypothetical protein n=1 Tax=Croceicoccus sp. YJ47 TaxID=2798724 RepID=UPI001922086F|nr:hypothetical protein [Croceicoccus sp. YJ47]QQN75106.1 hypothetical protein JD971_05300 [Croceicoccus sp. YJ47]
MNTWKSWVATAAMAICAVPGTAMAERPIADFTEGDPVGWVRMSPTGNRLAAEMDRGGERQIVIFSLDGQREPVVIGKPANTDVGDVRWVNDDWLIATVGRKGNYELHEVYVSRTMAFRADGTAMHMLEPRNGNLADSGGDVVWIARDGTPRILLSYRETIFIGEPGFFPKVAMVDVAQNKFTRVTSEMEGVWNWYADGNGDVRLGVGDEQQGLKRRLVYREGGSGLFKEVASATGDEELIAPVLFMQDGKALTISNVDGFDALYELDLGTMRRGAKVFGIAGADVSGVISDSKNQELRGVTWEGQRRQVQWLDPQYREIQALLNATLPGQNPVILSSNLDGTKHVVYAGGTGPVTGYLIFDSAAKKMTVLSRTRNEASW